MLEISDEEDHNLSERGKMAKIWNCKKLMIHLICFFSLLAVLFGGLIASYGYNRFSYNELETKELQYTSSINEISQYYGTGDRTVYREQYGSPFIYQKVKLLLPTYQGLLVSRNEVAHISIISGLTTLFAGLMGMSFFYYKRIYQIGILLTISLVIGIIALVASN